MQYLKILCNLQNHPSFHMIPWKLIWFHLISQSLEISGILIAVSYFGAHSFVKPWYLYSMDVVVFLKDLLPDDYAAMRGIIIFLSWYRTVMNPRLWILSSVSFRSLFEAKQSAIVGPEIIQRPLRTMRELYYRCMNFHYKRKGRIEPRGPPRKSHFWNEEELLCTHRRALPVR